MATRKPRLLGSVFVLILIGMLGVSGVTRRPRFAAVHTVDVVMLIADGMCFGVALAILLGGLVGARRRRESVN